MKTGRLQSSGREVVLTLVLVGACATPQADRLLASPPDVPPRVLLEEVPFHSQEQDQCGPASLAMVLNWSGDGVTPEELSPQVYTPGRGGSLRTGLVAAARRHSRVSYPIRKLDALLMEVAAGSPVVVLQNEPEAPAGYLGDALDRRGIPWIVVRMYAGETPPPIGEASGVASMGGAMGSYEGEEFPFLVEQKRYLAACTEAGVPVLGICLGCQLLADALGGRAYLADSREVVLAPVEATPAGEEDPVIAALSGRPVIRFHKDTFDVPPGFDARQSPMPRPIFP